MGQLVVHDSTGAEQIIWMQERSQSCGPACVLMVECIIRQQSMAGGEERVRFLTSLLPGGYNEASGTNSTALALVLQQAGIPASHNFTNNVAGYLGTTKFPCIAHVAWAGGGGHFVVVAKLAPSTVVCLDPWYALIEPPQASLPAYNVQTDVRAGVSLARAQGGTLSGFFISPT